mgnify:CR=1 FL=1
MVVGSGAWGTALALALLKNGHEVSLWSYFKEECERLRSTHENPFLKGVTLPDSLHFTDYAAEAADKEMLVFATQSQIGRASCRERV